MEHYEAGVIADFLSEQWRRFTEFAEAQGMSEEDCDAALSELERLAGRG